MGVVSVCCCKEVYRYPNEKHESANPQWNLAEISEYIFELKTPLHAYVLGEHTSMKNEL